MRVRDRFGYIYEVPDRRSIGSARAADQAQIVYDGFGDPIGFAFLAPLLPLVAKAAGALLPAVTSLFTSSPRPAAAPPAPTIPRPLPMPQALPVTRPLPAPATPTPQIIVIREPSLATPPPSMPPAQAPPTVVFRPRRLRRRRAPVRLMAERVTEQMVVPPPVMLRPRPSIVTAESSRAAPLPPATESSGGMSGWYPAQFGNYF
jgi:hypothetical protein